MACTWSSEVTVKWMKERVAGDGGGEAGKDHCVNGFRDHTKKFGFSSICKAIQVFSFFLGWSDHTHSIVSSFPQLHYERSIS